MVLCLVNIDKSGRETICTNYGFYYCDKHGEATCIDDISYQDYHPQALTSLLAPIRTAQQRYKDTRDTDKNLLPEVKWTGEAESHDFERLVVLRYSSQVERLSPEEVTVRAFLVKLSFPGYVAATLALSFEEIYKGANNGWVLARCEAAGRYNGISSQAFGAAVFALQPNDGEFQEEFRQYRKKLKDGDEPPWWMDHFEDNTDSHGKRRRRDSGLSSLNLELLIY